MLLSWNGDGTIEVVEMQSLDEIIHLNYPEHFWDFNGITRTGIHKLGKYPRTMVAEMQYELVKIVANRFNGDVVLLDSFCGSGTSLVVAQEMSIKSVGIDINPYAVHISKVKTTVYNYDYVCLALERIISNLHRKGKVIDIL